MVVIAFLVMASAKQTSEQRASTYKVTEEVEPHYVMKLSKAAAPSGHKHVWPVINLS